MALASRASASADAVDFGVQQNPSVETASFLLSEYGLPHKSRMLFRLIVSLSTRLGG
jgi:hypothetical protein